MAVTGGTGNQTKALGGNNPISLKGNTNNGIKGFFGGKTNAIRFAQYYRNTNVDTTKADFNDSSNDIFVPDASENETVPTSGAISFSDFRGDGDNGVIKQYNVTQTGANSKLNLSDGNTDGGRWNLNLGKNVPKKAIISGRCYSTTQTSSTGSNGTSTYSHANHSALRFSATAYNMEIDIDSGVNSASDPNSANNTNNGPRGIFGVGGNGGNSGNNANSNSRYGKTGGTAMYVAQSSNRSGASAIININSGNGRIYAGGGGGKGGYDGNDGNSAGCTFYSNKGVNVHSGSGANIRQFSSCSNAGGGCGNQSVAGIAGVPTSGYSCSGSRNRSRCRGGGRSRGSGNCFGTINKNCVFEHPFRGNSGNGGNGGDGGKGQGSGNISRNVGYNNPNSGNTGSCNDPTGGSYTITTLSNGNPGNDGNSGTIGGTYGAAAGNGSFQGKGGHAVYSNTKSQVKLSNTSTNKGKTVNVTT